MTEEEWQAGAKAAIGPRVEEMPVNNVKDHVHTWLYNAQRMEYWCSGCIRTLSDLDYVIGIR